MKSNNWLMNLLGSYNKEYTNNTKDFTCRIFSDRRTTKSRFSYFLEIKRGAKVVHEKQYEEGVSVHQIKKEAEKLIEGLITLF